MVQLIVALAIFLIGELLRPSPKVRDAKSVPFSEARLPSTDPEASVPVGWGRIRWSAPHLMGITDYHTVPIKEEVKTLFSSEKFVVGFRYFVTLYLGLGTGEQNLYQIYYDTKLLWDRAVDGFASQSATNGDVISINKPNFMGGRQNGGGIVGTIRFYRGRADQLANPTIAAVHTPCPAYRFTAYVVFENLEIGETPDLSSFEFVCDRSPASDVLGLGANFRVDGSGADTEVNPMAVIAELLTSKNFGEAEATSKLNTAQLKAMGDTLATEVNGISLKWVNEETLSNIFEVITNQIQGVVFKKIGTGLWGGRLVRQDYSVGSLKVLDMSNIADMRTFTRRQWPETINFTVAEYVDRTLTRSPAPATEGDFSSFQRLGRIRTERRAYPGVYTGALAAQLAVRELRTLSFPFASGELTSDRTMYDIEPTEPVKLVWPPLGIVQMVVRVASIGYGTSQDPTMTIGFLEDAYGQTFAAFVAPQGNLSSPLNTAPVAVVTWVPFEMPYYFQNFDVAKTALGVNKLAWVALAPQSNALNFRIYEETVDGGAIDPQNLADYAPTGTLQAALLENTADTAVTGVVIESVSRPELIVTGSAFGTDTQIRTLGIGVALIEAGGAAMEFVGVQAAVNNFNGTWTLTLCRGMIDTLPKAWSAGARLWFLSAAINSSTSEHGGTQTISSQLRNIAATGEAVNTSTKNVTLATRTLRPYPPGNFQLNGSRYPSGALTGDVVITWAHRDKTDLDAPYQNGGSVTLETGFEYLLEIYDAQVGGTKRRSVGRTAAGATTNDTTPLTGTTYTWSTAMQTTDGGPFPNGRVVLRCLGSGLGGEPATSVVAWEDVVRPFTHT